MLRPSRHARQRMTERSITPQEVQQVLTKPDVTFTDPKGNPCTVAKIEGRRIKVVTSHADPEFIITVIDLDS
jgi:hypothetical protein